MATMACRLVTVRGSSILSVPVNLWEFLVALYESVFLSESLPRCTDEQVRFLLFPTLMGILGGFMSMFFSSISDILLDEQVRFLLFPTP